MKKSRRLLIFGWNFSDTNVFVCFFGYREFNSDVKNTVPLAERTVGFSVQKCQFLTKYTAKILEIRVPYSPPFEKTDSEVNMWVSSEKTKKNPSLRVALWVRRQTTKLASGSAPSCADTIIHTF